MNMNQQNNVQCITITKCTHAFICASDLRPLVDAGLLSQFEIVHGVDQTRVTLTIALPADEPTSYQLLPKVAKRR